MSGESAAGANWRSVRTASAATLADAAAELHDVRFAHSAVTQLLASWDEDAPTGPDTDEARAL